MAAAYLELFRGEGFNERIASLKKRLSPCALCPHRCGVNRAAGETGKCMSGPDAIVASSGPHFGEERPLVGRGGSGTIFFSHCNLSCVFCQNHDISQTGVGSRVTARQLASIMLELQLRGCHNINLVSPTHIVPAIVEAVGIAAPGGLKLPIVYNCGGYESVETLKLLDGIIDIYMPDFKYADDERSATLSGAPDYSRHASAAVKEMFNQVGDLKLDTQGRATRGLLVRHLIMPGGIEESKKIIDFIAGLSKKTYLNLMDQYRPAYHAYKHPEIARRLDFDEYDQAVRYALKSGLTRLDSY